MIHAISVDMAFANVGLARLDIWPGGIGNPEKFIKVQDLQLLSTEAGNKKLVRVSSDDLRRVLEIADGLRDFVAVDTSFAFVEVPSGAQDAKAARALGMATGLLGVLHVLGIPIIEVSPGEVKATVTGKPKVKASKAEIIAWASKRWPDAPWLRYARDGKVVTKPKKGPPKVTAWKAGELRNDNEHLADALAIATAGVKTPAFQQALALYHATTGSHRQRPASGRVSLD